MVKFEKDGATINIKTSKGNYFFYIDSSEVLPLAKRLKASKDGKVKVADKDYGIEHGLPKFFIIKLDSKEDCLKLANVIVLANDYHTGKKKKPEAEKFILPWKK